MTEQELTNTLAETLSLFEEGGEPLTTTDVADQVSLGRRSAYERLERLVDCGRLETKKVGANARVWWQPWTASRHGGAEVTREMAERRERERQLRRERDLTEQLFEIAPVRFAIFDSDGSLDRANAAARERLGVDPSNLSAFELSELNCYDADGEPLPAEEHPVKRILDTGEPVSEQLLQHDTPEGERRWVVLTGSPLFDEAGTLERVVITGRDVTEIKRTQQQLERERDELEHELETIFDRIDDAFFSLDENWQFVHVNSRAAELVDRSVGELLGQQIWDAFPESVSSTFREEYERAVETQKSVTFEEYYPPLESWFEVAAYPSKSGLSVYYRDVTARKKREQELRQYESVIETVDDGVYMLDGDNRIVLVNDAYCTLTGYDRKELLGSHVSLVTADEHLGRDDHSSGELLGSDAEVATVETELQTANGECVPVETRFAHGAVSDGEFGQAGVVRDITSRKQRERELSRYETIVETVDDGIYTVDEDGRFAFVNDAYKEMMGLQSTELLGKKSTVLVEKGILEPEILDTAQKLNRQLRDGTVDAAGAEATISRPDRTTIETEASFNRLRMEDGEERVGVVRDITNHVERKQALERQREQLEALDSLNKVGREITAAVIDQSTRAEIESAVCELLAESDSYLFAWVGEVDTTSETVTLRTEAGVDGYLDDIEISVDPDDERSDGATGRAFKTGEMQTTRELATDGRYEPWRDRVEQYDFRSSAAIPIVHEDSIYGTLNVYAERPNAFEGQERAVVEQLGEVVGHAIAATERKQALLSNELVELQFHIPDAFEMSSADEELSGRVTLDHFVPAANDGFLGFGTVSPDAVDGLRALVDTVPHWEQVTMHDESGPRPFELRMRDPPMVSLVAGLGGAVKQASITEKDYEMTIHVPPNVDVQQIIRTIEDAYPAVQLRKRQQITQEGQPTDQLQHNLLDGLTDRQRTVLETARHEGFFDWPRRASGEEIAESLGIAAPTFHQHLRKAEQSVVASLFPD